MTGCAPHREFLAAMADGEMDLVPAATFEHVESCVRCAREVSALKALSARLRQAADQVGAAAPVQRTIRFRAPAGLGVIAAVVAAAVLVASAGAGWYVLSRPDPVQAAFDASGQPLQIESADPAQVGQWCLNASGREVPAIQLDGMQVLGARMDRVASTDIVTVVYTAPSGARVTVSWLEGQAPPGSGVEDRTVSGHELLIVHSPAGTAVILGSSSQAMWQTAAAIETAPG